MNGDIADVEKKDKIITPNQKPLLTHKQRESFVSAFIESWNTNQIRLELPKIDRERSPDPMIDLLILSSMNHPPELSKETLDARKQLRKSLTNKIRIVSGSINSTPEIIYKTINELYNLIVELQGANLLSGSFLTREIEDRIYEKVVEKVDKHVDKIREEFGLNDV